MQKSLLWSLLRTFKVAERRRAVRFLKSPYHNARPEAVLLFQELLRLDRQDKTPNRESIRTHLFPQRDATWFRLLQSHLYRRLEDFLIVESLREQPRRARLQLVEQFQRRKLSRHVERHLKRLPDAPYLQAENYLGDFRREQVRFAQLTSRNRSRVDLNLRDCEDTLDRALVAMKLRQSCITRSHETVSSSRHQIHFLPEILDYAANRPEPEIQLYRACFLALYQEPTDERFREYRSLLLRYGAQFPPAESRSLFVGALNFCIRKINENKSSYLREAFDLYRAGIDNETLFESGQLSRFTFNNVVGIALRLNELTWTERFLDGYAQLLRDQWRTPTLGLNRARYHYARQQYDEALVHLREVDQRDLITNMTAKILQLKIYQETKQLDLLDAHLRTMQRFVERNPQTAYHRVNWNNIIRFTRKVMSHNPYDESERSNLRRDIEAAEPLTEKDWLLGLV